MSKSHPNKTMHKVDWGEITDICNVVHDYLMGKIGSRRPSERHELKFLQAAAFIHKTHRFGDLERSATGVFKIARKFNLTPANALRFFAKLQVFLEGYSVNVGMARSRNPKSRRSMAKAFKHLERLAEYSQLMLKMQGDTHIAEIWIWLGIQEWARGKVGGSLADQRRAISELESQGFSYTPANRFAKTAEKFGATEFLRRWLRTNLIMQEAWKRAIELEQKNKKQKIFGPALGESALQLFAGYQLPGLYEHYVGRRFGIVKGTANSAQNQTGVLWVNMALDACGLPAQSPSNIETMWRKARKLRETR